MNEKFMKVMKFTIPTLTVILIASQLFGAPVTSQQETLDLIQKNEQIEIEIAVPKDQEQGTEKQLTWIQLYDLDNYQDTLRTPMEHAANQGYYVNPAMKEGVFYHNATSSTNVIKNNTLEQVLKMAYNGSESFKRDETIEAFAQAAADTYADLEDGDTMTNFYMALNGYFNLLPDSEPAYANPNSTITRAEFMALLMRAETPVDEDLTVNTDFADAVGDSEYNLYAQALEKDSYLNLSDGSLNEKTYNGTISRAEAIYMLMQHYYGDFIESNYDISEHEIGFTDALDGGNISEKQGYTGKDYAKSYEISYFINNPDEGVPSDIYKALKYADYFGYLDSETRADEGLTKVEAIEFLVNIYQNLGTDYSIENDTTVDSETNTEVNDENTVTDENTQAGNDSTDQGNTSTEENTNIESKPETPQEEQPSNPGGLTPNSQGFVILDEDANGDGILTRQEAKADGYVYYSLRYNDDGSNTTYLVDIRDGSIVRPGGYIENAMGGQSKWFGHTPEDIASVEGEIVEE